MWTVWALIGTFPFQPPQAARCGSRLAAGAFPVSRMVLDYAIFFLKTEFKV